MINRYKKILHRSNTKLREGHVAVCFRSHPKAARASCFMHCIAEFPAGVLCRHLESHFLRRTQRGEETWKKRRLRSSSLVKDAQSKWIEEEDVLESGCEKIPLTSWSCINPNEPIRRTKNRNVFADFFTPLFLKLSQERFCLSVSAIL